MCGGEKFSGTYEASSSLGKLCEKERAARSEEYDEEDELAPKGSACAFTPSAWPLPHGIPPTSSAESKVTATLCTPVRGHSRN